MNDFISESKLPEKVSKPGHYYGYSEQLYQEIIRSSQYVPGYNGTKLAVDIYRPAQNGQPVSAPLPVIIINTQYQRRGQIFEYVLETAGINNLIKHGYVILIADVRGSGASFGKRSVEIREQILDAKALLKWTESQPWCNGRIGMMGGSQMGQTQLNFALTHEPSLITITPAAAPIDVYDHHYVGGVWEDFTQFTRRVRALDSVEPAQPVDEDPAPDYPSLTRAREEHKGNIYSPLSPDIFRDTLNETQQSRPYIDSSPVTYGSELKESGVSIYVIGGWHDIFLRDSLGGYKLFGNKLIIGPWNHNETCFGGCGILSIELYRWFDYTLKNVENGIMKEPPVYFYTINAPAGREWQFADDWPLPNQKLTNYYFHGGPSQTIDSINDGILSIHSPVISSAKDDYIARNDIQVLDGKYTRGSRRFSEDMTESTDKKGLTYTTPPLDTDIVVTGHPVVHLWVTSTAPDGNFFAFLEEVDKDGFSQYVSDRGIRASRRIVYQQPPWSELGVPYLRAYEEDYAPLSEVEPVELVFDTYATSYIFRKGNRIRVTITCSHLPTYQLPPSLTYDPPPLISVYRYAKYPSYITLPVIHEW